MKPLELDRETHWCDRLDIHPRTARRWEDLGIIERARKIRGIRYRRRGEEPRFDDEQPEAGE